MASPLPPGWNRTVDDLNAEIDRGERAEITDEEEEWAFEYERSLFPADTVFPAAEEVWEAIDDAGVRVWHQYSLPFTNSREARLPRGERVRVTFFYPPRPHSLRFEPLRYQELLTSLVSRRVRSEHSFRGYDLAAKTAYFLQHFRRVGG